MTAPQVVQLGDHPELQRSTEVAEVVGGHRTDPMFGTSEVGGAELRKALEASLRANDLLATDPGDARYAVHAAIVAMDKPTAGTHMEVTATVNYRVVDQQTGEEVFERLVSEAAVARSDEVFAGADRIRSASEKAVQANIAEFVRQYATHMVNRARVSLRVGG